MKSIAISLILVLLLGMPGHSQQKKQKLKPYGAQIILTNGDKIKGIFYSAAEDSVIIADKRNNKIVVIPANIQWIKLRQKNRMTNGALIGTASGALLGGLVAAVGSRESDFINIDMVITIEGPDAVDPQDTFGIILGGAVIGSIIGAAIASKRIKYHINSNRDTYLSKLPRLKTYTLTYLANTRK